MAMDLTVTLEDRPGELARLTEALGNAGVNIEGLCAVTSGENGTIHVLVEDAAAARAALEGAGLRIDAEAEAIVLDVLAGVDRPGTAAGLAKTIADAGVNVQVAYTATHDRVVVLTADDATARQALGA